jgi:hypothetical protein
VHRIGKVARRVRPGCFEQRIQVRMARSALTRNAGELRFGNADRLVIDRPVDPCLSKVVVT